MTASSSADPPPPRADGTHRGARPGLALLVNDDGPWATGLHALRAALRSRFRRVVSVVPLTDATGSGTASTWDRTVTVVPLIADPNAPVFGCTGTPVDCVRLALLGDIAAEACVVVSGVNRGANLGSHLWYSGTVSAALEAARLDVPAVAASQQLAQDHFVYVDPDQDVARARYDQTAAVAADLAVGLAESTPAGADDGVDLRNVVLSLNAPAHTKAAAIAITTPDRHRVDRGALVASERLGSTSRYAVYGTVEAEPGYDCTIEPGSDRWAVRNGHHSVSVLLPHGMGTLLPQQRTTAAAIVHGRTGLLDALATAGSSRLGTTEHTHELD